MQTFKERATKVVFETGLPGLLVFVDVWSFVLKTKASKVNIHLCINTFVELTVCTDQLKMILIFLVFLY